MDSVVQSTYYIQPLHAFQSLHPFEIKITIIKKEKPRKSTKILANRTLISSRFNLRGPLLTLAITHQKFLLIEDIS